LTCHPTFSMTAHRLPLNPKREPQFGGWQLRANIKHGKHASATRKFHPRLELMFGVWLKSRLAGWKVDHPSEKVESKERRDALRDCPQGKPALLIPKTTARARCRAEGPDATFKPKAEPIALKYLSYGLVAK
jgi:hypothetical protein